MNWGKESTKNKKVVWKNDAKAEERGTEQTDKAIPVGNALIILNIEIWGNTNDVSW